MSISLRELLDRAEHGKAGKRGYTRRDYRWSFTGYRAKGDYRDKTEKTEGGFNYYLWDYKLLEKKKHGVLCLYSWDSATTRERLETITEYYNLPLRFTLHGGELYCKPLWWNKFDEWRYDKIVIDTIKRTISVYIDNAKGDIEKYNY